MGIFGKILSGLVLGTKEAVTGEKEKEKKVKMKKKQ